MTRKEIKENLVEYVESELGEQLELDDDATSDLGIRIMEAFKDACDTIFETTVDDSKLEDVEVIKDILDECVDAVMLNEERNEY